jgi:alginate O-acetyltransferase complex protein AlgI
VTFLSLAFVAFLAMATSAFYLTPVRFKGYVLLASSYGFYATWSVRYTALLAIITVIVYVSALRIDAGSTVRAKRLVMLTTVTSLAVVLGVFKYFNDLSPFFGGSWSALRIVAPLGLSYYLFKLAGYVVDVYWETYPAERSLLSVANYAAFFPQMMCGPIQRADDFFDQTRCHANPSFDRAIGGLRLILFGLFKKLVVADQLGMVIDPWFDHLHQGTAAELWLALYLFPIQLYADFSGITDLVIGIGRLFGVESPPNFANPFYAPNITEFWRRWHISLSSWLRDYVFTPLRHGLRTLGHVGLVTSLIVTMLAIGIWHGARSSYVVFGLINGVYMSVSALTLTPRNRWFKTHPRLAAVRAYAAPLLLFQLIVIAEAFFRAPTASAGFVVLLHGMPAALHPLSVLSAACAVRLRLGIAVLGVALMEAGHLARQKPVIQTWFWERPIWIQWSAYYGIGLLIVLLGIFTRQGFIYQQF